MKHPERGVRLWIVGILCWCFGMASAFGSVYAKGRVDGRGLVAITDPCSITMERINFIDIREGGPNPTITLRALMDALGCYPLDGVVMDDFGIANTASGRAMLELAEVSNVTIANCVFYESGAGVE